MAILDPTQLIRADLSDFPPYSMGHVPLADLDHLVKLDLNENPYGASPKAIAALAQMRHYHRYIGQDELRADIARYVGVDADHVVASNGADEIIDLVQRVFINRGDAIVDCPPSFEMYAFFARVNGARIISVPRRDDFSIDVEMIESVIASEAKQSPTRGSEIVSSRDPSTPLRSAQDALLAMTKLLFLTRPNNPDGGITAHADIERLLALPVILVLDEAYAEFAGESYAARVPTQSNLIVLRTFSKWAGLASLRVGYCIAPKVVAAKILQIKPPENVNAAGIVAARASLADRDYLMDNVRRIVAERERLSGELAQVGFLQPLPSHANFLLCRVINRDAKAIQTALAQRDILIRAFKSPRLSDYIRIAVGTPEQDAVLLSALGNL
ncbi:MAG: aminotransferase class I/II-fold pyridoxal phosphate-dependent enzyme [Chloroflexi bacterium]|nr:aminotransferase class I/II-fold pyridoxal phosphate-dependent enzyme [Chloroflexota bacterium]